MLYEHVCTHKIDNELSNLCLPCYYKRPFQLTKNAPSILKMYYWLNFVTELGQRQSPLGQKFIILSCRSNWIGVVKRVEMRETVCTFESNHGLEILLGINEWL